VVEVEWGGRLIRGWGEGWMEAPRRVGARLAGLLGAGPDDLLVADSTSVNLFKLVVAALRARPERRTIVTDDLNFPSDLYVLQGALDLVGGGRRLAVVRSVDGLTVPAEALAAAIDGDTALVALCHAAFKSSFRPSCRWPPSSPPSTSCRRPGSTGFAPSRCGRRST
jgi:kynureninase